MPVLSVDMIRGQHGRASRRVIRRPARDRAVQRWRNRVRCRWRRRHARAAQRDRHNLWRRWCPLGARTRSGDQTSCGTVRSRPCCVTRPRRDRRRGRVRTRANTAIVVPPCDAQGARESREGVVADGRALRRSPPLCDAGTSLRPCDVWVSAPLAADRSDARSLRFVDPRDEILLIDMRRSASRDPRRQLARVRIHPVRPGRVPSGACPGPGGAPA